MGIGIVAPHEGATRLFNEAVEALRADGRVLATTTYITAAIRVEKDNSSYWHDVCRLQQWSLAPSPLDPPSAGRLIIPVTYRGDPIGGLLPRCLRGWTLLPATIYVVHSHDSLMASYMNSYMEKLRMIAER